MHTGVNMGLGYGMNQLGGALRGMPSQATTSPDRAVPSATNTDQAPALGSSGIGAVDPLTKLAMKNMMQSGIGGMMPQGQGLGSSAIGGILSAIPGILALL